MKSTIHFNSVTSRSENRFDPTKNRDISRVNGDLEALPSQRLHYDLSQSYSYLKKHSACATAWDLNRTERFSEDQKSVKKKEEEDQLEAQKSILYPNYEQLSNKGKRFAAVSFSKAERKIAATPLDLVPTAAKKRGEKTKEELELEAKRKKLSPEEQSKILKFSGYDNPQDKMFDLWQDLDAPDVNVPEQYFKKLQEARKRQEEEEEAAKKAVDEEEEQRLEAIAAKKAQAEKIAEERSKVWKEMHNHVPGEYQMSKVPGRDGLSVEGKKRKEKFDEKVRSQSTPLIPHSSSNLRGGGGGSSKFSSYHRSATGRSTSPNDAASLLSSGMSGQSTKKARNVESYNAHVLMEAEREKANIKAHLFRSDTGRDKAPLGQARGLEVNDYPVQLDPDASRRKVKDPEQKGQSFTTARRILDDLPKLTRAEKQEIQRKREAWEEQKALELAHAAQRGQAKMQVLEAHQQAATKHQTLLPEQVKLPPLKNGKFTPSPSSVGAGVTPARSQSRTSTNIPSTLRKTYPSPSAQSATVTASPSPVAGRGTRKGSNATAGGGMMMNASMMSGGGTSTVVSALHDPDAQRNKMFDALIDADKPKPKVAHVEQLKQKARDFKPRAHYKAKTGFHLEDFLRSKKFKQRLAEYEENLIRENVERWEQEDMDNGLITPRTKKQQGGGGSNEDGEGLVVEGLSGSTQEPKKKKKPKKLTYEDEERRLKRGAHLAQLLNLTVEHDDSKHQWQGTLPKQHQMVVDVGVLAPRADDVDAQASWVSPEIRNMLNFGRYKNRRQKELDAEYKRSLIEWEDQNLHIAQAAMPNDDEQLSQSGGGGVVEGSAPPPSSMEGSTKLPTLHEFLQQADAARKEKEQQQQAFTAEGEGGKAEVV